MELKLATNEYRGQSEGLKVVSEVREHKKKKNKGGQPTVMTPKVMEDLKKAFLNGFTDREACLYAEISHETLYAYCRKNPKYTDQKEAWKDTPKIFAKQNIVSAIRKGSKDDSKWYLERRSRDEFAQKSFNETKGEMDLALDKESKEAFDGISEFTRKYEEGLFKQITGQ